jgi:hypothetical protein
MVAGRALSWRTPQWGQKENSILIERWQLVQVMAFLAVVSSMRTGRYASREEVRKQKIRTLVDFIRAGALREWSADPAAAQPRRRLV